MFIFIQLQPFSKLLFIEIRTVHHDQHVSFNVNMHNSGISSVVLRQVEYLSLFLTVSTATFTWLFDECVIAVVLLRLTTVSL